MHCTLTHAGTLWQHADADGQPSLLQHRSSLLLLWTSVHLDGERRHAWAASMPEMSMVGKPAVVRRSSSLATSEGCLMPKPHSTCASAAAEYLDSAA